MNGTEKAIRNEKVCAIDWMFERWLQEVRLNLSERSQIEKIIKELKELIDY